MEITPLGDSAIIVRVRENTGGELGKNVDEVLAVAHRLGNAHIPGVIEIAPAYTTVGVFLDPAKILESGVEPERVTEWLNEKIREALSRRVRHRKNEVRSLEIPVCFDPEFAFDLAEVSMRAQLPANEVVDLYCAKEYRVACVGFTPGFPYLIGLPKKLATWRRATPRKEIPAGSVAIGGEQTGIYPLPSPGGWNVIGRTALRLFDPEKNPPALLRAGDRVRFRAIKRNEFERSTS